MQFRKCVAQTCAEDTHIKGSPSLLRLRYPRVRTCTRILGMEGKSLDWRLWGGALLAGGAVGAVALAMPVHLPEPSVRTDPVTELPEGVVEPPQGALGAFLEIRRWGTPPKAPETAPDDEAVPALNPILAQMGFVGLIAAQGERSVLLALPEGEIVRMLPGDILPDGRILVSVTDNALTLKAKGGAAEVLTLFPRLPAETAPLPARGDSQSPAQGGERIDITGTGEAAGSQ